MTVNMNEIDSQAEVMANQYNAELIDTPDPVGLHREVKILSKDWFCDFIIGMYIGNLL